MPKDKRSFVWRFFDKDLLGVRKCRKCPYSDKSKSATTSAMVTHLRSAHGITQVTAQQQLEGNTEGEDNPDTGPGSSNKENKPKQQVEFLVGLIS
jgi:hypothetical protein